MARKAPVGAQPTEQKKQFYTAQARFKEWLEQTYPKEHEEGRYRCMWQEMEPIPHTNIYAMECWLIGQTLWIVQFWNDNHGFQLFRQDNGERKTLKALEFVTTQMEEQANKHYTLCDYLHGSGFKMLKDALKEEGK